MTEFCVVFITFPDRKIAMKVADALVSEKLCACAGLSEGLTSIFTWKGQKEIADEILMIAKTHSGLLERAEALVRSMHPYEVFEFIALPVLYGNQQYLDWIKEVTS